MFHGPSLHLYIRKDNEKLDITSFFINILLPMLLLYYFICKIKEYTSIREFIDDKYYEFYSILIDKKRRKISEGQKNLKIHNIETEISKFKNQLDSRTNIFLWIGLFFIIFNWHFTTSFCAIYENSTDCLISNTLTSIFSSLILSTLIILVSAILRYIGLKFKSERIFNFSLWINPEYFIYGKDTTKKKVEKKEKQKKNDNNENIINSSEIINNENIISPSEIINNENIINPSEINIVRGGNLKYKPDLKKSDEYDN